MKLLIIGQTPPPFYGQSINIGEIVQILEKNKFDYRFIRMHFSNETNEVGSINPGKIWKLITLWFKIAKQLVCYKPDYVYYPPAGPDKTPVIRDILLLFFIRLTGLKRIFHYHAGGIATIKGRLSRPMRWLFQYVYLNADQSICLSSAGTGDPIILKSKKIIIIPSGVPDPGFISVGKPENTNFNVLFAGVCRETKGVADFIEVIRKCRKHSKIIKGTIIGHIFSEKENKIITQAVKEDLISYGGMLTGDAKLEIFRQSQILLFPSFFESENFPTVILEAFSFGMPVVSTNWRGIPDQIVSGQNGFLHEIHDIDGMATSVINLASDSFLYKKLSFNARQDFVSKYRMSVFESAITEYLKSLS
jgi:glycosyltransferase involved in cell wall biosynthesis